MPTMQSQEPKFRFPEPILKLRVVAYICNFSDSGQGEGVRDRQIAKAHWPASIAESMGFGFSESS